jgi:hypothetical protein
MLQHSGYTLETSELEIGDNPQDYGVTEHSVHIHSDDKLISRRVNIDNAAGMDALGLKQAWQTAGNPKKRTNGSIGKFGIGLNGATLSMCKDISIATRQLNGPISCLHASVRAMKATNSFEPTEFTEDANEVCLIKHFHPSDIEKFLTLPSGTMIQEMDFHPEMIVSAEQGVERIKTAISCTYPQLGDTVKFSIQLDNREPEDIRLTDRFYHKTPDAIRFKHNTELNVYESDRIGGPCRVIEHLTSDRKFRGSKLVKGNFYEHFERKKGEKYSAGMKVVPARDVQSIEGKRLGVIQIEMIQVNDDTYALEPEGHDNKGFHLIRDKRNIGSGLRLGHKIHDRTDISCDRQRMQVRFDPDLDKFMGSTWSKTIRDAPLPQMAIGDALFRIYRQCATKWTEQCEDRGCVDSSSDEYDSEESHSVDIPVVNRQPVTPQPVETVQEIPLVPHDVSLVETYEERPVTEVVEEKSVTDEPITLTHVEEEVVDLWVTENMQRLLDPIIKASILRLYGL